MNKSVFHYFGLFHNNCRSKLSILHIEWSVITWYCDQKKIWFFASVSKLYFKSSYGPLFYMFWLHDEPFNRRRRNIFPKCLGLIWEKKGKWWHRTIPSCWSLEAVDFQIGILRQLHSYIVRLIYLTNFCIFWAVSLVFELLS